MSMKNENNIENKISQALNSIEGIESAEVKPFFYTRLQAKMENEIAPSYGRFSILANLKLSLAMLAVIMVFNLTSLVFLTSSQDTSSTATSALDEFSEEYFSSPNNYDYLNEY
ncbi:hypothetical protein AWN68_14060 [Roseivirga echinicomitans]|uniref:Uncharacterized protein n=2 Tax=Roseivirga echinicomitans TaxID=296218 RepID=A0A150XUT1_9BACT|nr:hypothetical protein AWN68_14060 [Roseivirga echinicomitans]